jgi:hypothetical protein
MLIAVVEFSHVVVLCYFLWFLWVCSMLDFLLGLVFWMQNVFFIVNFCNIVVWWGFWKAEEFFNLSLLKLFEIVSMVLNVSCSRSLYICEFLLLEQFLVISFVEYWYLLCFILFSLFWLSCWPHIQFMVTQCSVFVAFGVA